MKDVSIILLGLLALLFLANHMERKATEKALNTLKDEGVEVIDIQELLIRFPAIGRWASLKVACVVMQIVMILGAASVIFG